MGSKLPQKIETGKSGKATGRTGARKNPGAIERGTEVGGRKWPMHVKKTLKKEE